LALSVLRPSLIFAGRASEVFVSKYQTTAKLIDSDKYSSLLRHGIFNSPKSFIALDPCMHPAVFEAAVVKWLTPWLRKQEAEV